MFSPALLVRIFYGKDTAAISGGLAPLRRDGRRDTCQDKQEGEGGHFLHCGSPKYLVIR
jgi:hypothetical protein